MMNNSEQIRKKVYVETTVVSDATALPTNDLTLRRRMDAVRGLPELVADQRAVALAMELIRGKAVPEQYPDDALHIATAALNAMDYLVSWNFKHITNAQTIPLVRRICERNGYRCPEICTPQMLQKGDTA